jgi:3-(3-hydroxy-phenyl)propionate hydroxylase
MVGCDGGNSSRGAAWAWASRADEAQPVVVIDLRNDPLGTPRHRPALRPKRPWVSAALPHGILLRFELHGDADETEETLALAGISPGCWPASGPTPPRSSSDPAWPASTRATHAWPSTSASAGRRSAGDGGAHHAGVAGPGLQQRALRDASNLGWKLALVARGLAGGEGLLDT